MQGLKQDTEHLTLEVERLEVENATLRQEKEQEKRLAPDLAQNEAIIGGLEETLESTEKQHALMEEAYERLKKDFEFVLADLEAAKQRIDTQSNTIATLENQLEVITTSYKKMEKRHEEEAQLIVHEQEQYVRAMQQQNLQLQLEVERVTQLQPVPQVPDPNEDGTSIRRYT
ncbi:hypothetical protein RFI_19534, partial [Reticulomyxa filosa]